MWRSRNCSNSHASAFRPVKNDDEFIANDPAARERRCRLCLICLACNRSSEVTPLGIARPSACGEYMGGILGSVALQLGAAAPGVGFGRRALPEKLENEVSRCCNGKHADQRGHHSTEIANVLHFLLPVEGASR